MAQLPPDVDSTLPAEHNLSSGSGPGDQDALYSAPWNERLKGEKRFGG